MAQGSNSTHAGSRPTQDSLEQETSATEVGNDEQTRINHIGMDAAKRAGNRIAGNDEEIPSSTIFSK